MLCRGMDYSGMFVKILYLVDFFTSVEVQKEWKTVSVMSNIDKGAKIVYACRGDERRNECKENKNKYLNSL